MLSQVDHTCEATSYFNPHFNVVGLVHVRQPFEMQRLLLVVYVFFFGDVNLVLALVFLAKGNRSLVLVDFMFGRVVPAFILLLFVGCVS